MLKKKIGIIDCDFGNIASLVNAIKYLEYDYKILKKNTNFENFSHLILPGVGSFHEAAIKIKKNGIDDKIKEYIEKSKPFMGICVGMQLMFEKGVENGIENGLGIFNGTCEKFSEKLNLTLPHIGFNLVENPNTKIWHGINSPSPFYFVHSYRVSFDKNSSYENTKISKTNYGEDFISFIEKENVYGAQFHPEKSHKTGLSLLNNFAMLN
jgi:imidazole glycerol-phosphate synthase subunit HisH